jgi:hypothetical protein
MASALPPQAALHAPAKDARSFCPKLFEETGISVCLRNEHRERNYA